MLMDLALEKTQPSSYTSLRFHLSRGEMQSNKTSVSQLAPPPQDSSSVQDCFPSLYIILIFDIVCIM